MLKKLVPVVSASVFASIVLLSLNSCATIFGDNRRTVCINSQPKDVGIYIEGERCGTTPASITFPSHIYGGKTVILKKEGFYEQAVQINTRFQRCGLWNLLFLPGFLIDLATGDSVKIERTQLNLMSNLEPIN